MRAVGRQSCRGVLQGAIAEQQSASVALCSPFIFLLSHKMVSSSSCCPGCLRWLWVALGSSCGTGQGGGLLQQQRSGIWLGYGQQICFPWVMKRCKTREVSGLPWVARNWSSGCPQLGCREWWMSPLLLSPLLTSVHRLHPRRNSSSAFLSVLGDGRLNSLALMKRAWLCCRGTVVQLS